MSSRYDLTAKLVPFMDRHFVIPILMFLNEGERAKKYKQGQIQKA